MAAFISLSPGILYFGTSGLTVRIVVIPFFRLEDCVFSISSVFM